MLKETTGATNSDRNTSGSSVNKGADFDRQVKLELCTKCKEYKRTVVNGLCYDCNYKKLPIDTKKLNNLRLKEPVMVYEYGIIHTNDKERDLIIQQCKNLQSTLNALIDLAEMEMSDLRKFRDIHNKNADAILRGDLNHEIISSAGRR
ncbi:hypothetical protein [Methanobacterium sp.]|uniref:hypothetical protein n=1 Tax=Methanobacterium sp. TaxID=2164 RepID=UPI003C73280D